MSAYTVCMAPESITKIHDDLGFAAVEPKLREVTGVWAALQLLKAKAGNGTREANAYRQFLERCIKNLNATEVEMSPEAVATACDDFVRHLNQLIEQYNIYPREHVRGAAWEPWMAKHLPNEYAQYTQAMDACNAKQTLRTFERLNHALEFVLKTYAEAFDDQR